MRKKNNRQLLIFICNEITQGMIISSSSSASSLLSRRDPHIGAKFVQASFKSIYSSTFLRLFFCHFLLQLRMPCAYSFCLFDANELIHFCCSLHLHPNVKLPYLLFYCIFLSVRRRLFPSADITMFFYDF